MNALNIGFIWQVAYPWDVRLDKFFDACTANGHRVALLCKGKGSLPPSEDFAGIRIQRVYPPTILGSGALAKAAIFPLFFNPLWVSQVSKFVREGSFDLLVVRDIPLAYLVGLLGQKYQVPVILDMAENYPAALKAYEKPLYKPFLLGNSWLPKIYEQIAVKKMAHIFVVTEESAARLRALGVPPEKLTLVGNTPEQKHLAQFSAQGDCQDSSRNQGKLNLLYVGKVDPHRGVELIVRVMPDLLRKFPELTLSIVGDGTHRHMLANLAQSLGLASRVQFCGWVAFKDIWKYIQESTICLIPHLRSEHTDTTLPNKLFDYMAVGKPVVASACIPMERVIREVGCGATFDPDSTAELTGVLTELLSNPELRRRMGDNGKIAVNERYNWDHDRKSLMQVVEHVGESSRKSATVMAT